MDGVTYITGKPSNFDKNFYSLSDIDITNLESYLHQQARSISDDADIDQYDQDDMSLDFYVHKILEKIAQPVTNNYRYHHHHHHHSHNHNHNRHQQYHHHHPYHHQPHFKHIDDEPIKNLSPDYSSTFSLEVATCGMQKNTQLPVPCENFSLIDGLFGDDAGFTMQNTQHKFLGISDGAGGNLMYGYDPRLFSESLMRNCSDLALTGKYSISEPKRLLSHAFDRVQMENCFGSATACILGIDCQLGQLHSVNIGDSGYVIVRQGYVVYRSQSQEMNGDCPRQLDVYPWTASLKGQGLNYTQISIFDAICQTFDLELNDVIILSTDGLFDNVSDFQIEQILARTSSLKHAASELVTHAVRFYIKPDDILVIMARVTSNPNLIHRQGESIFT
ncbi:unnamed protein product [Adineta steineri]|uniref:Protein phosphatase n=1 Tax=Adineta steineri TaxID=433720 RepID=A0A819CQ70_9BILA|nr:unnamed protein product [Adineta steineri]CAF3823200.1 unnamed protein product [Adineta steineri]